MADTGHTAGQFEGHTPGPWRGNISGTFSTVSDHAENDETLCWIDLEPGAVVWTNPADYTLAIAAPSLLARAEAAEERVRVLEAALDSARALMCIYRTKNEPGEHSEAWRIITEALATGVQHG